MPSIPSITFAEGGPVLDRAAHLRRDAARMAAQTNGRSIPFLDGKPLVDVIGPAPRLAWRAPSDGLAGGEHVFLGIMAGVPRFAVAVDAERAQRLAAPPKRKWIDLRSIAGTLDAGDATAAATAKALLGWHATHRFCAGCGAPTHSDDGGWRRRCAGCGALHFPRTDPVVIMLITAGDAVLVGRQPQWPEGLYSLLAGFVEPGETIEDAVRREVMEEARIAVGAVRYLACQPWPFPMTLMIGCAGRALSHRITVDETELNDARWVTRADIIRALAGEHPVLASPRRNTIARALLSAWAAGRVSGA